MDFIPHGFTSVDEYLAAALNFLGEYEWLYNWPVTEILSRGVLDRVPAEWWPVLRRLSIEELNALPRGASKPSWPPSLRKFVQGCAALRLPAADAELTPPTPLNPTLRHALRKGLTPKKLHEITHLSALVHDLCQRARVTCVVDMGSGHGYLCEMLHFEYGYQVLGLESVPERVQESRLRHQEIARAMRRRKLTEDTDVDAGESEPGVRYLVCDVSAECPEPIVSALSSWRDAQGRPSPFCLVGLHACGDLTPSALRLFMGIEQVRVMALVPCCYHLMRRVQVQGLELEPAGAVIPSGVSSPPADRNRKLRLVMQWSRDSQRAARMNAATTPDPQQMTSPQPPCGASDAERTSVLLRWTGALLTCDARAAPRPEEFEQFPLSARLRQAVAARTAEPRASLFLRRPFLRLAAQETVERWELLSGKSHRHHSVHVMARAVFNLYTRYRGLEVQKRRRRCARNSRLSGPPRELLADMVDRMLPCQSAEEVAAHKEALSFLLEVLDPLRPLIEAITGLQMALQNACEGLVLVDRLVRLYGESPWEERVVSSATIVRVADQLFTPRCLALVAIK